MRRASLERLRAAHRGVRIEPGRMARPDPIVCGKCKGQAGDRSCGACLGEGWITGKGEPLGIMPAELAESMALFFPAYGAIKRLGVDGWLRLSGPGARPDPDLLQLVLVMDCELERLEFEDDVADALKEAKARPKS